MPWCGTPKRHMLSCGRLASRNPALLEHCRTGGRRARQVRHLDVAQARLRGAQTQQRALVPPARPTLRPRTCVSSPAHHGFTPRGLPRYPSHLARQLYSGRACSTNHWAHEPHLQGRSTGAAWRQTRSRPASAMPVHAPARSPCAQWHKLGIQSGLLPVRRDWLCTVRSFYAAGEQVNGRPESGTW